MDLRRITDFDAPELDVYARLTENQLLNRADPQNALFVAESPLVIGRALDAGYRPVSCLLEEGDAAGQAMLKGRGTLRLSVDARSSATSIRPSLVLRCRVTVSSASGGRAIRSR